MRKNRLRYACLEGGFWHNDKICRRSLAALGLHAKALAYCADKMADGRLPKWIVPALAVGVDPSLLVGELVSVMDGDRRPMWIDRGDHYELVAYAEHNITVSEWAAEKVRIKEAVKEARNRKKIAGVTRYKNEENDGKTGETETTPEGVTRYNGVSNGQCNTDVSFVFSPLSLSDTSSQDLKPTAPREPSAPNRRVSCDVGKEIKELEARYNAGLITEARTACALSRRSGKMADSAWLKFLKQLASYPADRVNEGMRLFAEKHADGEKDERYLLGIVRRLAKQGNGNGQAIGATTPAPSDPLEAEYAALRAELDAGAVTVERRAAIDQRLSEIAAIRQGRAKPPEPTGSAGNGKDHVPTGSRKITVRFAAGAGGLV